MPLLGRREDRLCWLAREYFGDSEIFESRHLFSVGPGCLRNGGHPAQSDETNLK
jgi:hypothetical protein